MAAGYPADHVPRDGTQTAASVEEAPGKSPRQHPPFGRVTR
jgi:hypothetical protein